MNELTECGAPALIPADHSADALGELAADCCLVAVHSGDHNNGMAVWAAAASAEQTVNDRAALIVALVDDISAGAADLLLELVALSILILGNQATDEEILADALVTMDGLFAAVPAVEL